MRHSILVITVGLLALCVLAGCSKKATKISEVSTEPMETTKPPVVVESEEPITPEILSEGKGVDPKLDLIFRNVNFDFDKYDLRPDSREILADHARVLQDNPQVKLSIEGHCDERGTIEYNLSLGDRRANAVKSYLINYGINHDRFSTISYGKERPLDRRSNEEAWAQNRRAAFVIKQS